MSDVALTPSKRDVNDLICLCLHLISWQMREQSCILLKKQSNEHRAWKIWLRTTVQACVLQLSCSFGFCFLNKGSQEWLN